MDSKPLELAHVRQTVVASNPRRPCRRCWGATGPWPHTRSESNEDPDLVDEDEPEDDEDDPDVCMIDEDDQAERMSRDDDLPPSPPPAPVVVTV